MATLATTDEVLLMANSGERMMSDNGKLQMIDKILRFGPAWALLIFLVAFLCWGTVRVVSYVGPTMKAYIEASAVIDEKNSENVGILIAAQSLSTAEHVSMLQSLQVLQASMENNRQNQLAQQEVLDKLLALFEDASRKMGEVPTQREQELLLLREIKLAIEELKQVVLANAKNNEP